MNIFIYIANDSLFKKMVPFSCFMTLRVKSAISEGKHVIDCNSLGDLPKPKVERHAQKILQSI